MAFLIQIKAGNGELVLGLYRIEAICPLETQVGINPSFCFFLQVRTPWSIPEEKPRWGVHGCSV